MSLRDHPLLANQWPPAWVGCTGGPPAIGEIGVLKRVVPGAGPRVKCFLFVEHLGNGYIGTLLFPDPNLCAFFNAFWTKQLGRPLEEIGQLDFPEIPLF
jgi:hypothetical protein